MQKFFAQPLMIAMLAVGCMASDVAAQQPGPPARSSTELGNFGDTPFANPQIIITRAEDRAKWRQLEDKQLKERRDFEDKVETELKALRARQAVERDAALKSFTP